MARIEWAMWANENGVIACGSKSLFQLFFNYICLRFLSLPV